MKRSGNAPPARVYTASPRPYPARLEDPWYDATHQVRRVKRAGRSNGRGSCVFVSEAVRGELVGLAETATGDWRVQFHARGTRPHRSKDAPVYAGVAWPVPRMSAARRCGNAAAMEISHRTEIPTADHHTVLTREEERRSVTSTKCYRCIRSDLLPMFPVAQAVGGGRVAGRIECRSVSPNASATEPEAVSDSSQGSCSPRAAVRLS